MDIDKITGAERLALCRRYFFFGFAGLPLVWLVNFWWFWPYAFRMDTPQKNGIKKYVIASAMGVLLWTIIFIFWVVFFQIYRLRAPVIMDYLTFIFPIGDV